MGQLVFLFPFMTPIHSFPDKSPFPNIVLKREDLSEYGSHKFRYFEKKLKQLKEEGFARVVLSTTGNAGITASRLGKRLGIQVLCLMHELGSMNKAAEIEASGGVLILSKRPLRFAKYLAKRYQMPFLRMSNDAEAIESYRSLGEELMEQVPDTDAIVNFATSGTSSLGLMEAYLSAGKTLPALHLVQSGKSCSIVQALHPEEIDDGELMAGVGLSDTPHREELLKLINDTQGDAHYISNEYRKKRGIHEILQDAGIETSWEGKCSFAAAMKIAAEYQKVVVILSGKPWSEAAPEEASHVESFADLDRLMEKLS